MTESWLDLAIPYFVPICRGVFDAYFVGHGFGLPRVDRVSGVTYSNGECCIEISYWLEDSPLFTPMVAIGVESRYAHEPPVTLNRIGLWYAIPANLAVHDYGSWRFSNPRDLEESLLRIRDEVIDKYAKPLWLRLDQLIVLIQRRSAEFSAAQAEEARQKKITEAAIAFKEGKYAKVLNIYSSIGVDNLTPAERKRYEIAARRIKSDVA